MRFAPAGGALTSRAFASAMGWRAISTWCRPSRTCIRASYSSRKPSATSSWPPRRSTARSAAAGKRRISHSEQVQHSHAPAHHLVLEQRIAEGRGEIGGGVGDDGFDIELLRNQILNRTKRLKVIEVLDPAE